MMMERWNQIDFFCTQIWIFEIWIYLLKFEFLIWFMFLAFFFINLILIFNSLGLARQSLVHQTSGCGPHQTILLRPYHGHQPLKMNKMIVKYVVLQKPVYLKHSKNLKVKTTNVQIRHRQRQRKYTAFPLPSWPG